MPLVFDNNNEPLGSFDDGVTWAISKLGLTLGLTNADITWDAATETYEGDVTAVICGVLTLAFGDEWQEHIAGRKDGPETYPSPRHGWTCFHCGATFHDYQSARLHFGTPKQSRPVCINGED